MGEYVPSKLYTFIDSDGKQEKFRVNESKLDFVSNRKCNFLFPCIYRDKDFADYLNYKASFRDGYKFFRTGEIKDRNGTKGRLEIAAYNNNLIIKFGTRSDTIKFKIEFETFRISLFLTGGEFANSGFGSDIMKLIQQSVGSICLSSTKHSEEFYLKVGFRFDSKYDFGDLKGMDWTPKTEITPELRIAVNVEAKRLRKVAALNLI
jgi:hypothetical protein